MKNDQSKTHRSVKSPPTTTKGSAGSSGTPAKGAAKVSDILGRAAKASSPPPPVPERWRWHFRALQSLQSQLTQDSRDLRRNAAEPLEPHSLDEADSATDEFDHNLALTQLSAEGDALREVNQALNRILNGQYGICEESRRAIPAARLRAIPWTRFTREVEERLEREGGKNPVHIAKPSSVHGADKVSFVSKAEEDEAGEAPVASQAET